MRFQEKLRREKWLIAKHKYDKSKLKEYREIVLMFLLAVLIWTFNVTLATNLAGAKVISISNDSVVEATEIDTLGKELEQTVEATISTVQLTPIEQMIVETFPEEKEVALALFKAESGHDPKTESWTDRMVDGRAFSIGLVQLNLSVQEIDGVKCFKAFEGRNYKAKVINEDLYQKCVHLAKNPELSLKRAREIYQARGNFSAWGAFTSGAYKRFL